MDIKSAYDPNVYYVNVVGTRNIADLTKAAGGRLVYISSVHAIPLCQPVKPSPPSVTMTRTWSGVSMRKPKPLPANWSWTKSGTKA